MDHFLSSDAAQTAIDRLELAYLYGGVVQYRPGETLGPRVLGDYELVLIIEGQVSYRLGQIEHRASPGTVILARPGFHEAYRWDPVGVTRHAYFHFDINQHAGDWPDPESWPFIRNRPAPVIGALFRHVIQLIYSHPTWPAVPPGPGECRVVETIVSLFLEEQLAENTQCEYSRPEPVHRTLRWMRQMIDDDPRRRLRLADLVRVACVTDKHLCRLYRKTLGWSPMQTYNLLRLQLSLVLLTRTNLTIKQIADRSGYDNQFYFSRCFTKTFGRSPNRVRHDLSLGVPPPPSPLPVDITPRVHW